VYLHSHIRRSTDKCDRLERTLRLSRNTAADGTDAPAVLLSQRGMAQTSFFLCNNALSLAWDPPATRTQAVAALNQTTSFAGDLETLQPASFFSLLKERVALEPRTGKCDAIFMTSVSLGDSPGELKEYLMESGLVKQPNFTPPKSQSVENVQITDAEVFSSSSHLSPTTASGQGHPDLPTVLSSQQKKILKNPLRFSCTESNSASALPTPTPECCAPFDPNAVSLSGFVAEYKKWNDDETKALHQERTYLVSLVTYLAALGIKGFGVFGLITSGQVGGILMAWQSKIDDVRAFVPFISCCHLIVYSRSQQIYIIERNIRTFDLSSPIQAFQFASFLIRLREHTETLKELFNNKAAEIWKKAENGELPKWTKEAQTEMKVVPVTIVEGRK